MGFKSIGEAGHARSDASHRRHHAHVGSRRHAAGAKLRSKERSELRQRSENDDQLTLGREQNQLLAGESRSLAVARFKSDLRIKQTDDGALQVKFKSQLRFNYEFQSEDGTTIQLSAKVKTRLSYEQSADGSFELKTRVKFQISALQESVQAGVAPALDSGDQGESQNSAIANALKEFQSLVDQITGQFLEDAASGDDLIVEIVDAFNQLTGSVGGELPDTVDQPKIPSEATPLDSIADNSTPPAVVPEPSASEVVPQGTEPTVETPTGDSATPLDGEVPAEQDDGGVADATSTVTRRSVLVDLRIKFVQSISGLANVLDSPVAEDDTSSINAKIWQRTKIDFRLATYHQTQTRSLSDGLAGITVDADA